MKGSDIALLGIAGLGAYFLSKQQAKDTSTPGGGGSYFSLGGIGLPSISLPAISMGGSGGGGMDITGIINSLTEGFKKQLGEKEGQLSLSSDLLAKATDAVKTALGLKEKAEAEAAAARAEMESANARAKDAAQTAKDLLARVIHPEAPTAVTPPGTPKPPPPSGRNPPWRTSWSTRRL